ncbi:hypothetical protein BH23PLA1_BH23PLA1_22510 [soil metagenome]
MARCDEGYPCEVCGGDVEDITDSDLYLRYVIGEVDPETLHQQAERHLRCNPTLAQFIKAEGFEPVEVEGPFDKAGLDPEFVAEEEERVTRGYLRLKEIFFLTEEIPITEYPLPEVIEHWKALAAQGP